MSSPVTWTFKAMGAFFISLAILQGCDSNKRNVTSPPDDRFLGYFDSIAPPSMGSGPLDIDSTYEIVWTKGSATTAPYVNIYLYQGDSLISRIAADHPTATGQYKPLTFEKGVVGSGLNYRIKIVGALPDTAQHDFGKYFSLTSKYTGAITLSSPKAGAVVTLDSSLLISWSHSGDVGTSLSAELYKGGTKVSLIAKDLRDGGNYTWPRVSTPLGSGSDYRIKITSYQDPAIFAFGPQFQIKTRYNGSITVTSPKSGDSFIKAKVGSIPVAWSIEGTPGTEFALYLYSDTTQVRLINDRVDASKLSYSWSDFTATEISKTYRLKILSKNDPSIFSFSGSFTFLGMPGDAFEPDGSRGSAKPIGVNSPQSRSLAKGDTDWVQIDAKPGKAYSAKIKATGTTYVFLCDSNGNRIGERHRGEDFSIPIDPLYVGRYFLRIDYNDVFEAEYTTTLIDYDTSMLRAPPEFISPDSASVWITGSRYNIKWVPDTALYGSPGSMASFSLYRESRLTQSIGRAANSGTLRWTPPDGLPTSDRYRIRIGNYYNPLVYSFGPYFTIKGMEPDAYEPDDSKANAKAMADSEIQRRTLSYLDTDWVQIDSRPGQNLLATVVSGIPFAVAGYDSDGKPLPSSGRSQGHQLDLKPNALGKYLLCISTDTSAYPALQRKYSLFLRSYDSTRTDFPLKFGFDSSIHFKGASNITWVPDTGYYGGNMRFRLYKDTSEVKIKDSNYPYSASNSGTYSWSVPNGLISSSRYRLRAESDDVSRISTYSPYFHIDGMQHDEYEPDNTQATSKTIATDGAIQHRNLTYSDTDWIAIDAVAGKNYLVSFNLMSQLNFRLIDSRGVEGPQNSGSMMFVATESKRYFLRAQANALKDAGEYSLFVYSGDTAQGFPIRFSAPDTNTSWVAGSTQSLVWTPDEALYGARVILSVYQGSKEVLKITPVSQTAPNSGTYSWVIPAGLVPGNNYQIRMDGVLGIKVFGFSRPFSIGAGP
jgi:hypothetical protein